MSFREFAAFLCEYIPSFFIQDKITPTQKVQRIRIRRQNPYWRLQHRINVWIFVRYEYVYLSVFYYLPSFFWRYTFGRWIYVKHNLNGFRIEYNNLKFLYDHSREFHVPVPRPYFSFVFRNRLWPYQGEYLFMTRIHGHDLHQRWLTLSHSQKSKIISQLRSYTIDMRSVKPPAETKIGSFSGGPVDCCRLLEFEEVGPFVDEHHLNRHLRGPLELASLSPAVLSSQQKQHELCATHNDLFPRNIMVDDQLNIVAIVDWKSAGWFPVYWEYCMCRNWTYNEVDQDWKKWVSEFLDPWIEEEIADRDLLRAYPNFMVYWSTRVNPDSVDGYELYKYLRSSPK